MNRNISMILQHIAVIALALSFYYIDEYDLIEPEKHHMIFLTVATLKTIYFLTHSFKKVKDLSVVNNFSYFMKVMSINISLVILSYAADYFTLFQIYPSAFTGITTPGDPLITFCDFFYFSVTIFSTTGLGDILPYSLSAKYLVCLEVILAFITIIFLLSNFANLKSSHKEQED
ncbi:ion channel [Arcticibacter eurypsychrophilus]|uniref:ion channel n=1 Tax=Arcticibacter eurypsychrophilus TaxID=1434752 RepID=UPI00084DD35C|nr:ion channel [Arcticibacter eurypsychrophilus]